MSLIQFLLLVTVGFGSVMTAIFGTGFIIYFIGKLLFSPQVYDVHVVKDDRLR